MQERIKILGVSIDPIRLDKLLNQTQNFLNQDAIHVIYLAGLKTALRTENDESFALFLEHCDCVLAAARSMEEQVYNGKASQKDKMLLAQRFLERLLFRMNKNHSSLYLIGNNQTKIDRLENVLQQSYSNIVCNASSLEEETKEDALDFIVNDINAVAPDVMFVLMDGDQTKEFVEENRTRMDVRLCVCIGEAEDEILQEIGLEESVPNWILKFGLESVYHKLFHGRNIHHTMLKRMFQKKIREQEFQKDQDQKDDGEE